MAVTIAGPDRSIPPALAGRATVVERIVAHSGDERVDLLAVDPATFAAGAGVTRGQADLVAALGRSTAGGRVPAIVVGDLPDDDLRLVYDLVLPIETVAAPARFPTMRRGSPLVVVRQDALAPEVASGAVVLGRGDPVEVEAALRDAGRVVTGVASPGEIISATSFAAVRWAYNALRALGVLVIVVLIGVELATASARAPLRRVAEVLTTAMGLSRRRAFVAVALEHGAPLALGAGVGVLAARLVARVAVPSLDSARTIPPVATSVVPLSAVTAVAVVGLGAVVVATVVSRRVASHAKPVEVLRGG